MRAFTVIDVAQRSPEWFAVRLGKLTGSRADDMLASRKDKVEAAGRQKLRAQLVLERITGRSAQRDYQSGAMRYGAEQEADAVLAYETITGRLLQRTGFLAHTELLAGCSLDGHFGDFEGIVEIKCPESHTHYEYVRSGRVPLAYLRQITHALWLTDAAWCDWLSYDAAFPESTQAKLVRVHRRQVDLVEYDAKARAFLTEVDAEVQAFATVTNLAGTLQQAVGA